METKENAVVLKICDDVMEAHLIKAKLESYGVNCMITNTNFSTLLPVFNNMMGGMVRVYVLESQLESAKELLEESVLAEEKIHCPECNSVNLKYGFGKKRMLKIFSMLPTFLALIPFMPNMMVHRCRDCGFEFK
jgi:DNA-directed RNA polymerase subunit RPC12/RpoP